MKRLTVRLTDEDARKVSVLRGQGLNVSLFVREALRGEFERRRVVARTPEEIQALIDRAFAEHPNPEGAPPRDYDVADRHQAAAAIRRKLRCRDAE